MEIKFIIIFLIFASSLFSQVDESKITHTIPASQLSKEILADNHIPIKYENVKFKGDVILQKIDYQKISELKQLRISKKIEFNNCIFESFYAQKCIFDSSFSISKTIINKQVDFSYSKFYKKVEFLGIDLNDNVYFEGVVFNELDFSRVNFNGWSNTFRFSIFNKNTEFHRVKFEGESIYFNNCIFINKLYFFLTDFNSQMLTFEETIFLNEIEFNFSNFNSGYTIFNKSQLYENLLFIYTSFNGRFFGLAEISILEGKEIIYFEATVNSNVFYEIQFQSKLSFNHSGLSGSITFNNTIFDDSSQVEFNDCDINKEIKFRVNLDTLIINRIIPEQKEVKYRTTNNDTIWLEKPIMLNKIVKDTIKTNFRNFHDNSKIFFNNCIIAEGMLDIKFDNIYDQERSFNHFGDPETQTLREIHRMYSQLKYSHEYNGDWDEADDFYYEWKQIERRYFWKDFWKNRHKKWYNPLHLFESVLYHSFNWLNWFSCGYGVKPLWIFPFAFLIVCLFAIIYFFIPQKISNLEEHLISKDKITKKLRKMDKDKIKELFKDDDFDFGTHKQDLIEDITSSIGTDELSERLDLKSKSRYSLDFLWHCFYFSFSTFTTIGIGDWYPSGKLNKAIVMLEGSLGWLCLGLFITTYANILLR